MVTQSGDAPGLGRSSFLMAIDFSFSPQKRIAACRYCDRIGNVVKSPRRYNSVERAPFPSMSGAQPAKKPRGPEQLITPSFVVGWPLQSCNSLEVHESHVRRARSLFRLWLVVQPLELVNADAQTAVLARVDQASLAQPTDQTLDCDPMLTCHSS